MSGGSGEHERRGRDAGALARMGGFIVRQGRRIAVIVVGSVTIVVGIVILPTLLPGWLVIFTGLGILATEFAWAARSLKRGRREFAAWSRRPKRRGRAWARVLKTLPKRRRRSPHIA